MTDRDNSHEAEAKYEKWTDAAEHGEFHPVGEAWVNPDHPDCRQTTPPDSVL